MQKLTYGRGDGPYLSVALPPLLGAAFVLGHGGPRLLLQSVDLPLVLLDQTVLLSIMQLEDARPLLLVLQSLLHHLIGQQGGNKTSSGRTSLSS